jgi:hypothetical protein
MTSNLYIAKMHIATQRQKILISKETEKDLTQAIIIETVKTPMVMEGHSAHYAVIYLHYY